MLKITEHIENKSTVRLRLDGTLSLESLDSLMEAYHRHRRESRKTILLDMSGVNFINDETAKSLVRLRSQSLRFIHCSPFISTLLETVGGME